MLTRGKEQTELIPLEVIMLVCTPKMLVLLPSDAQIWDFISSDMHTSQLREGRIIFNIYNLVILANGYDLR